MSVAVRLYHADSIDDLPWPDTADGIYARNYLVPFIKQQPAYFIDNVQTNYMALLVDEHIILPISLNEHEYANSYVCSPYTHYVTYAREEAAIIQPRWLRQALSLLVSGFGLVCKCCRINRAVHVNNWLLSTNLYPSLSSEQVAAIVAFLRDRFPRHTIIFRALTPYCHAPLLAEMRKTGARLVPSRQVYFVHPAKSPIPSKARWLLKRDYALLAKYGYSIVLSSELEPEDIPRIVALYNALYLQKHSMSNPMFNEHFIELALQQHTIELVALKKAGCIDAVLGYFCRNGVMTTPVFGYDLSIPQEIGLYRMLSAVLFRIAQENGRLLHESSGAAQFKRNRGATGAIEYSAIYDQHLPISRRLCWSLLETLLERIGVPLLRKYKL